MNKRITSLALVFVMVLSLLATAVPVFAADSIEVKMTADKETVHPSTPEQEEIITYTVQLGETKGLYGFKFKLTSIPEGLEFVPGSGKLADGLKETLQCYETAWTESTKVFYAPDCVDGAGYTSADPTILMTFQCKVAPGATGTLKIEMIVTDCYDISYNDILYTIKTPTITVTAAPATEYDITVTDGKATNDTGATITKAAAGTKVTITADAAPAGQVFDKWVVESGTITLADANSATTTFTMPAEAVEVKATYKTAPVAEYDISVTSGKATVEGNPATKAAAGKTVTITADAAPSGKVFDQWVVESGTITLADASSETTTFTMPGEEVSVKATYKTVPATEYDITVTGGAATVGGSPATKAAAGKEVTITANAAPGGQVFDKWVVESGSVALANETNETTTFTMPASNVEIKATYKTAPATEYNITVESAKNGTITVSPKSASKGSTVTITVKPDKGYELDTLKVLDSKNQTIKLTEKDGKLTFTMPASKVTVKGSFKAEAPVVEHPFTDIPEGSYYEDAVIWAVDKGVTGGTSATTFTPDGICTRAQAVTFLWRAAGSPEPKTSTMPFTDVKAGSYYYDAVLWAVEQGITAGTSATTFAPDLNCSRAQIVTFLYRAAGSPAISGNPAFSDVASDAYYAKAVKWAEANGITSGIGGGLFGSDNDCTRAQIVTFIYRYMEK